MNVQELYRITSHKKIVEVDDVSTSRSKLSNQVLIVENQVPDLELLKKEFSSSTLGTILVVDAFDKDPIELFDAIDDGENKLMTIKKIVIEGENAIICLPENYITFYLGQELTHIAKTFQVNIITLSDRAHRGIYEDLSGPLCAKMVSEYFEEIKKRVEIKMVIIPDNAQELELIAEEAKHDMVDLFITTGGTGISPRDITVETMKPLVQKEIPGIMEMIRMKYGAEKPNALLSRGIAGVMDKTLVYTLPGSTKAVKEYLSEIFTTLNHLFFMLHGIDNH